MRIRLRAHVEAAGDLIFKAKPAAADLSACAHHCEYVSILRSDYERLVASIPATLRVVR